jgi:hypothetical protein
MEKEMLYRIRHVAKRRVTTEDLAEVVIAADEGGLIDGSTLGATDESDNRAR